VLAAVVTGAGQLPQALDRADPVPADGQCLVRVAAAPITPLDLLCAGGESYFGVPATPYVPGVQGVGRVVAPGAGIGVRVWFPTDAGMRPGDGSLATLCTAAPADLVPVPDEVPDELAAALGMSAVAAWAALTDVAGLRPGEQVLVLGAGGVVGQVAVQAARLLGARRVVAVCRSATARRHAETAGADAVVPLVDGEDVATLAGRYADALDGAADVVVDPLCGPPATAALEVLAGHGRLVNLGSSAGPTATFVSATLRSRSARILGYTNNGLSVERRGSLLREVLGRAAAGRLTVTHEVVPLHDVTAAWRRQRDGAATSRLVVRCR
jgi:NADPH:quinone reductase-like Zn-dependent oxidoreductase